MDPLKLVPLRSTGVLYKDKLFIVGGGAFCFSFGSIFNEMHFIDVNELRDLFERQRLQNYEFKCSNSSNEIIVSDALIVDKEKGKCIKDILKNSNNLNTKLKARSVEFNTKIAFPVCDRNLIKDISFVNHYVQKLEFEYFKLKLSPVENLRRKLIQMINNIHISSSVKKEELIKEIPVKWEMLGDIVLIPENAIKSKEWPSAVYKEMAEILGASRLARQYKIANNSKFNN